MYKQHSEKVLPRDLAKYHFTSELILSGAQPERMSYGLKCPKKAYVFGSFYLFSLRLTRS